MSIIAIIGILLIITIVVTLALMLRSKDDE